MKAVRMAPVLIALGACTPAPEPARPVSADPDILKEVPEAVRALAAPGQDLSTVKISPTDGCYYYLWNGPVESTFLPLRTAQGNPICTAAES